MRRAALNIFLGILLAVYGVTFLGLIFIWFIWTCAWCGWHPLFSVAISYLQIC